MSADRWAVEYSTGTVSGVRFFGAEAEAEAWAAEQRERYGAVALVVRFTSEYGVGRANDEGGE